MTTSAGNRRPARSCLAVLEAARAKRTPVVAAAVQRAEEEWLACFRKCDRAGLYEHEPDFPRALEELERAIGEATACEPSFLPPVDFQPDEPDVIRRQRWRSGNRYPEVNDTIMAVMKMTQRAVKARMPREGQHAE